MNLLTVVNKKFLTYSLFTIILLTLGVAIYIVQRSQSLSPLARPTKELRYEYRVNNRTIPASVVEDMRAYLSFAKNEAANDKLNNLTKDFFLREAALRNSLESRGVSPTDLASCQNIVAAAARFACMTEMSDYAQSQFLEKRSGMYLFVRFDNIVPSESTRREEARERSEYYLNLLRDYLRRPEASIDAAIDEVITQANNDSTIIELNHGNSGGDGARRLVDYTRSSTETFIDPTFNTLVFNTKAGNVSDIAPLRYVKNGAEYGFIWVFVSSASNTDVRSDFTRWLEEAKRAINFEAIEVSP